MEIINSQTIFSILTFLHIFAGMLVLGDLSDLAENELLLIAQMENFEQNLGKGKWLPDWK